jgi:hypothetical protein
MVPELELMITGSSPRSFAAYELSGTPKNASYSFESGLLLSFGDFIADSGSIERSV